MSPTAITAPRLRDLHVSVVDVETTGFNATNDRIIEIAVVRFAPGGTVDDVFSTLVNSQCDPGATHIHGITADDLVDAPMFGDVADAIVERLQGTVLVAHNASFDRGFIDAELARTGRRVPDIKQVCTLAAARKYLPNQSHKLGFLCEQFNIDLNNAHAADADAIATGHLLYELLSLAEQKGLGTIANHASFDQLVPTANLAQAVTKQLHALTT